MTTYLLTDAAEADLREIIRYTCTQWGDAQVRSYIAQLERGIARLAAGEGAFKPMSEIHPALRMAHCEHHYVFCLPRDGAPALVVAILHERMDLMARLADRLVSGVLANRRAAIEMHLRSEERFRWHTIACVGLERASARRKLDDRGHFRVRLVCTEGA